MTLIAAADGSALGNPGPAGWGWYIDERRWASGGWPHGTNNMGELTAVLDLLQQTANADEDLLIYCDSRYVINSVTTWMAGWKRKGWRKGDGKPVLNVDIMKALDTAMQGRRVKFEWIKGHTGHPLNEEADRLANAAAQAHAAGREPESGPGFGADAAPSRLPSASEPDESLTDETADLFSAYADTPSDTDRVVTLERLLLSDAVRAEPAAVAALLHPNWTEVGRSGRLWTRDEMLTAIEPLPSQTTLNLVSVDRIDSDTILLVWRSRSEDGSALRSSLWVREHGDWQQRFHQGTAESA